MKQKDKIIDMTSELSKIQREYCLEMHPDTIKLLYSTTKWNIGTVQHEKVKWHYQKKKFYISMEEPSLGMFKSVVQFKEMPQVKVYLKLNPNEEIPKFLWRFDLAAMKL